MAIPTNTYTSFDMKGILEDLSRFITDVSPEETPFYTRSTKVKATNYLHEWQTDELDPPTVNAHVEGDDTIADPINPTVRLGNRVQTFKKGVSISDGDEGLDKAGRGREMAYQVVRKAAAMKRDIELALFANQASVVGSSTVPRRLAGVPAWLKTNTVFESGGTPSGADPSGDGTDARVDNGTPVPFTQTRFNTAMQAIWESGGKPDTVYLSSFQMNAALGFTGNNNQRSQIQASRARNQVVNDLDVYVTPWGVVEFVLSRWNRPSDVIITQSDKWQIAIKRPMRNVELAKTGDSTKRQILTELTLVSLNEKASGAVYDNTTV